MQSVKHNNNRLQKKALEPHVIQKCIHASDLLPPIEALVPETIRIDFHALKVPICERWPSKVAVLFVDGCKVKDTDRIPMDSARKLNREELTRRIGPPHQCGAMQKTRPTKEMAGAQ
ncbi:hypothetical protein N9Q19_01320 [Puniceicoccaceae bacterium]|nr:hypothetical protein [Puniceicoccaceae bacterium]